jgi:ATP-binding cassette subfamily B protein
MTDNNKLAHSFERPLSFFAYEKQKIKKFYEFIQGYKIKSQNNINPFVLSFNIYKEMDSICKKNLYLMIAIGIASAMLEGLIPYFEMLVYGSLPAILDNTPKAITTFLLYWVLLNAAKMIEPVFNNLRYCYRDVIKYKYNEAEQTKGFADIIRKPRPFFKVNSPSSLNDMVEKITNNKVELLSDVLDELRGIVVLCITGISVFLISAKLFFVIVVACLIYAEFSGYASYLLRNRENKKRLIKIKVRQTNRDIMANSALVQDALNISNEQICMRQRMKKDTKASLKLLFADYKMENISSFIVSAVIAFFIATIALHDIIVSKDIGRLALIYSATSVFRWRSYQLILWYKRYLLDNRNEIVDTQKQLITPHALERKTGSKKLTPEDNTINIKDIRFSYPKIKDVTTLGAEKETNERGNEVIKGITTTINPGEITVVAGTSGEGKTTLMSLIRHDYDLTSGSIKLGTKTLTALSDNEINKQIAFVDQNVHFFDQTLLYNLKYFKENASEEELQKALDSAGLTEDILNLKDGVYHRIGQDGSALSGGQRQRLALARIFLTDRPIMILDEPTTGLDQVLSFKVMKTLKEKAKNKTVLLVTHNPTEIALADRVIVIKNGQIESDGTPLDLIETSPFLKSSLTKQDILSKQKLFSKIA